MIVECYVPDYSSPAEVRYMIHVTQNEWIHLYSVSGLTFPAFRLTQHESTRFLVTPRNGKPLNAEIILTVLSAVFREANLKHVHEYGGHAKRTKALGKAPTAYPNLEIKA